MSQNKIGTVILILFLLAGVIGVGYLFMNPNIAKNQLETKSQSSAAAISEVQSKATKPAEDVKELKIDDLKVGEGVEVKSGDTISINYKGTLLDGTEFDSSYKRNKPFETKIGVGQVIQGWDQGILGLKVGGKRKLTIPSSLGYGPKGSGASIPPNAGLVFEVELMSIK